MLTKTISKPSASPFMPSLSLVCGLLSILCQPGMAGDEPIHGGRTLSEWAALIDKKPPSHQAMYALGEMGEPAIPVLIKAMRSHRDGAIRWLSHVALAKVGRAALPELDKVMVDGDRGARTQAVLAFEKILGREAIPRLLKATQDRDAGVRVRAHGAMLRLGEPKKRHLPPMLEILRDKNQSARWLAAEALGQCGPKAAGAEDALTAALKDPAKAVATRAMRALEKLGTVEALRRTLGRLPEGPTASDAIRTAKLRVIFEIGRAGQARTALPDLRSIVAKADEDVIVRGYAAWAIEQTDPRPAAEPGRTYHVAQEHPRADDRNPGTAEMPWKTIQHAAETLRAGDTVLIHAGVYREFARPFLGGTGYDRMITYRAAPGEKPELKGSDPWHPEWQNEGKGLWSAPYQRHSWDFPEKWPKPRPGPMHRAEQTFVDGKLLTHVEKLAELKGKAGRFYTDDKAGRLWVHLVGEKPPSARFIERSTRQQVFAPAVRGLGYVRVQGLTMRHAAAPESNGANWHVIGHRSMMSVRSGHHWIIEDNTIEWGNAQGLDVGGEGFGPALRKEPIVSAEKGHHQVRRNRVSYHGVAGIVGWARRVNNLLLEDNETNFNCQKGNFYQYEAAGVKLHNAKDCIIRRHRSHGNHAFGIWLDHLCERNRVTQCVLTENMAAGFFFEVSAGPLLADNNVVIGTRYTPRGNWADGIYSHDGNRATYINNYVFGCKGHGVRLRNLFSRIAGGKPTTTSHNRILNNFIFNCGRGTISLNPDVPRAEDNQSDHNVLWARGRAPAMRLDHAGTKVQWQTTKVGRALGKSSGGNLTVPFDVWKDAVGKDRHSVPVPRSLLFDSEDPRQILETLKKLWPVDAPGLNAGYGDVRPQRAAVVVGALRKELKGGEFTRTVWLGPAAGVEIWRTKKGLMGVRWRGTESAEIIPIAERAFLNEPLPPPKEGLTVAGGDAARARVAPDARIAFGGLRATIEDAALVVSADMDTASGDYGVVVVTKDRWQRIPVRVSEAYIMGTIAPSRDGGNAVTIALENRRARSVRADVTVRLGGEAAQKTVSLPPRQTTTARVPVKFDGVGEANISVKLPGTSLSRSALVSFTQAKRAPGWSETRWYEVDSFPNGAFPPGAEAFALFQGGLSAKWAARYDDEKLLVRVEVQDDRHVQKQKRNVLWKQDSVQLLVKARADVELLELDLALPSGGATAAVFRRQWPGSKPFPGGVPEALSAMVTRKGQITTYEAGIPWAALGLGRAPAKGTPVRFSLLVNDNDGKDRHGLQWFFGIHTHRGKAKRMGTLWME